MGGGGGWSYALASAPASGPHRFKFFKQVLYVFIQVKWCIWAYLVKDYADLDTESAIFLREAKLTCVPWIMLVEK